MIYVFGDYELDTQLYELRHAGTPCKLEPQAFNVLAYLMAHHTRVVTKQELLDSLWPHHSVSESTLTQRLKAVRKAVGDDGRTQQVIKTVHGRGYRFVAPLRARNAATPVTPELLRSEPLPHATPPPASLSPFMGERKLVTVLCGMLANTAAVAEQHGFEVLRCVREAFFTLVQHEVQRYAGRLQSFADDGFLALFGIPVTQEDHALRAILAAGGIQQQLRACGRDDSPWPHGPLAARLGVHTGLMMVDTSTGSLVSPTAVTGEEAALAIQVQYLAEPGMLLASTATMQLVHGTARGEAWTEVPVPGRAENRVMTYRVQVIAPWHGSQARQRRRSLSRFVGRERELATLQALLAQATEGQGHVVGIVGEPGMGKSRLLYELRHRCTPQRVTVLEGHCLSYGTATPYLPVRELVRHYCDVTETDDAETITAQVAHRLHEARLDVQAEIPYLLRLLGVSAGTESLARLSPRAIKDRTFATLQRLFLQRTLPPRLMMVENLHWIDATSEEWLTSLVAQCAGAALLLLTTYRPGYHPPWIDKSYVTQVALSRLVPQDGLSVVQSVPQAAQLPVAVVQEILAKADGNPFFLEELTWAAVEHGDHGAPPRLPDTIQAVLAARIDRLPAVAKRLVQMAAVIGKDLPLSLLQAVAELPDEALSNALLHLQAAEFLYEIHGRSPRTYTFKHALTRDAAYQSLLAHSKKQLHERIARILLERFAETADTQPELLAHHYTEAGLHMPAVEYWLRAGKRALERSAHVEAVCHLTTGLRLLHALPDGSARVQQEVLLQVTLGSALIATRGFSAPEVAHAYARARELCRQVGNAPQLFAVLRGLFSFYNVRAEFQTAYALGEQLLIAAQYHHNPALLVAARYTLGTNLYWQGEFTAAHAHLEKGLASSIPQPLPVPAIRFGQDPGIGCLARLSEILWILGYPDQAQAGLQSALSQAHRLSHPFSLAFALVNNATGHQFRREIQDTHEQAEALLALTTEQGFPQWLANGAVLKGWALAMLGQGDEGIVQIRQGITAWQTTGAVLCLPYLLALLAEAYRAMAQPAAGLPVLAEALALVERTGERWWEAELHRLLGELLLAREDKRHKGKDQGQTWEEAAAHFHQALAIARRQQARSLELRAAMSLSSLWRQQGKHDAARELLAPIYSWFTEGFDTADLQEAKALLKALET